MMVHGTKGLIDIEKQNLDNMYAVICLEENRSFENVAQCQRSISTMLTLLNSFSEGLDKEIINGNQ